ncbi:MAG: DUF1648 domain-containing protein [bacterium]
MRKIHYITIEILSLLCLLWAFYPLLFFNDLGDNASIPIHYNFKGEVDGWSSRSSLWTQPITALVVYMIFSILVRYPEKLNYPIKVTKENMVMLHKLMIIMLRYIKLICLILFAYGSNLSFGIAIGENGNKNHYVIVGLVGLMFVTTLFYVLRMLKYKE